MLRKFSVHVHTLGVARLEQFVDHLFISLGLQDILNESLAGLRGKEPLTLSMPLSHTTHQKLLNSTVTRNATDEFNLMRIITTKLSQPMLHVGGVANLVGIMITVDLINNINTLSHILSPGK